MSVGESRNMPQNIWLRPLFARFSRGRLATCEILRLFRSATQLPHGTVRNVPLPAPGPLKSRFSHLPRIFARAAMLFILPALLFTVLIVKLLHRNRAEITPLPVYSQDVNTQDSLGLSAASQPQRPIFKYSIIRGGVRDARELQAAASRDPIVAQHYSDFRIGAARTVRLEKPLEMYVSYRRNNQVYWTKNRMVIPAGESLISDGENLARVRCGNRLSAIVAKPVATTDPTKEELNEPEFVPPLMAEFLPGEGSDFFPGAPYGAIPALPTSGPTTGSKTSPPGFFPPPLLPGSPLVTTPPVPPVRTPEPGTFTFLFAGSALVILFAGLTLRRNGSS